MGPGELARHDPRPRLGGSRRVDAMWLEIAPTGDRPRREYPASSWPGQAGNPWGNSALAAAGAARSPGDRLLSSCGSSGERYAAFDDAVQLSPRVDHVGFGT